MNGTWDNMYEINMIYHGKDHLRWVPKRHFHPVDELAVVAQGRSLIVVDEAVVRCEAPYLVFYPKGMPHYQLNDPETVYQRWCVSYDSTAVEDILNPETIPHEFCVINLTEDELKHLLQYMEPMYELEKRGTPTADMQEKRLLLALILNTLEPIVAKWRSGHQYSLSAKSRMVCEICKYINEHCAEMLTLDGIAKAFFISRSKLARSFRTSLDTSVKDYIRVVRVARAKMLLLRGVSIQETSQQCGFTSTEYFIKVFHRTAGVTPAQFRNICEGEPE